MYYVNRYPLICYIIYSNNSQVTKLRKNWCLLRNIICFIGMTSKTNFWGKSDFIRKAILSGEGLLCSIDNWDINLRNKIVWQKVFVSLSLSLSHTHTHSLSQFHSLSHTLFLFHSHSHTHAQHTLYYTHTLSHTHRHSLSFCLSLSHLLTHTHAHTHKCFSHLYLSLSLYPMFSSSKLKDVGVASNERNDDVPPIFFVVKNSSPKFFQIWLNFQFSYFTFISSILVLVSLSISNHFNPFFHCWQNLCVFPCEENKRENLRENAIEWFKCKTRQQSDWKTINNSP